MRCPRDHDASSLRVYINSNAVVCIRIIHAPRVIKAAVAAFFLLASERKAKREKERGIRERLRDFDLSEHTYMYTITSFHRKFIISFLLARCVSPLETSSSRSAFLLIFSSFFDRNYRFGYSRYNCDGSN